VRPPWMGGEAVKHLDTVLPFVLVVAAAVALLILVCTSGGKDATQAATPLQVSPADSTSAPCVDTAISIDAGSMPKTCPSGSYAEIVPVTGRDARWAFAVLICRCETKP